MAGGKEHYFLKSELNFCSIITFLAYSTQHILALPQYSDFSRLCDEYEYPSESSAIVTHVLAQKLTAHNYHSKYHKLIYLEEIESSRKIITE